MPSIRTSFVRVLWQRSYLGTWRIVHGTGGPGGTKSGWRLVRLPQGRAGFEAGQHSHRRRGAPTRIILPPPP